MLLPFNMSNKITTPPPPPPQSSSVTFDALRSRYDLNTSPSASSIPNPRNEVLRLSVLVGQLCNSILLHAPLDDQSTSFWVTKSGETDEISSTMGCVLLSLLLLSNICGLDLQVCILKKMALNERKYPVESCKAKAGKYTQYSKDTGITKTKGQNTTDESIPESLLRSTNSISKITERIRKFATEREWSAYHTPRNLVLALTGELGELAELFQFRGDPDEMPITEEDRDKVGQEIADVAIYLMRMADVCRVDLEKVVADAP